MEAIPPSQKHFVLDTNVLLHDPQSMFCFQEHVVWIPVEVLEELDKFKSENTTRGANARGAESPGAGLGLAIVRTIVEAHGGTVSIRSVEGAGTTVQVELPLALS